MQDEKMNRLRLRARVSLIISRYTRQIKDYKAAKAAKAGAKDKRVRDSYDEQIQLLENLKAMYERKHQQLR